MSLFTRIFGNQNSNTKTPKRRMVPFHETSDRWKMAAMLYQETRQKVIPGRWTKDDAYPVIDGFRAMTADEIFRFVERLQEAQSSGKDVFRVVNEIEDEARRVADEATGERVRPS